MASLVESFLDTHIVRDIKRITQLITLSPNDSVASALDILSKKGITAAAVYDPHGGHFLGFVDTLDLAVFIVKVFAENYEKHPHLYDPKELDQRFNMPVKDVINASNRDVFHPIEVSETLNFLITNFLQFGVHRVPVTENGQVIGIVSQSDVIKYLYRNAEKMPELMSKKLHELRLISGNVITIGNDQTLMKAFTTILVHNITGLAVVDLRGRLVNNISASDLKGISLNSFYKLEAAIHEAFLYRPSKLPPVSCGPNAKLGDAMSMMEKTGVHRIFVVDDENRPISVVTLTDVLKLFAKPYECC